MSNKSAIGGAFFATALVSAGCTQILGGDNDYYLADGGPNGAGGESSTSASSSGDGGSSSSSTGSNSGGASSSSSSGTGGCTGVQTSCNGACVDTATDVTNCGACGHDCQGTPCNASVCSPVLLASGQPNQAWGIALTAAQVVWTTNTGASVLSMPLLGGAPTQLNGGQDSPKPVAVDDQNAYWGGNGIVKRNGLGGGGGKISNLGSPARSLAVSGTYVLVTTEGGDVLRIQTNGASTATLASGEGDAWLTADATQVYWTTTLPGMPTQGRIRQVATLGGTKIDVATLQNAPDCIAVDATDVFWINSDGPVMRAPKGGGAPKQIATAEGGGGHAITVDATSVYWANSATGKVSKAPIGGGTPLTLAKGLNQPWRLAVDGTSVYWTNLGDGTVMKVAK